VGNFMTDRNSSRILAPPGGASSFSIGGYGGVGHISLARSLNVLRLADSACHVTQRILYLR
jgi:hypothetical protein